ncbi:MAG: ABC transporter permease [Alphaproteobacteria bacterium]
MSDNTVIVRADAGAGTGRHRRHWRLPLALGLALRDLRGGIGGFRIFVACLALGVAAIAAVLSLSRALDEGTRAQGRFLLGADAAFSVNHRRADQATRAFFAAQGRLSEMATMRAMARGPAAAPVLVEIKAVDANYPLYGTVKLAPKIALRDAMAARQGTSSEGTSSEATSSEATYGAVVEAGLLARLGLRLGQSLAIGETSFEIRAVLEAEPDRLSSGFGFGPRVLISAAGLKATKLVRPGSLVRWHYKVALQAAGGAPDLPTLLERAQIRLEEGGWRTVTRVNATPGIDRFVDRLTLFLSLLGLTALVVGGVGVANATAAYLEAKARIIATLKCLGAPSGLIFRVYLIEIAVLACLGIGLGLAVGAGLPVVFGQVLGTLLPLPAQFEFYLEPMVVAGTAGALTTLTFALWPLGRARRIAPAALFRDLVAPAAAWPGGWIVLGVGASWLALAALVVVSAQDPYIALFYAVGTSLSFVVLFAIGHGLMALVRRLPAPRIPELRLGLANIARPGAATPGIVLSLGLGLALLVMVGLVNANLERELVREMPERAPSYYFVDIQRDQLAPFTKTLSSIAGVGAVNMVPMLRGRIVKLNGKDVTRADTQEVKPHISHSGGQNARWVLQGDRGLTFSRTLPEGSTLVRGKWWAPDYAGPPLMSFVDDLAMGLGLEIGDTITVNVLGRDITAKIANTRRVDWRTLGINFVMIFSPGLIETAPHSYVATTQIPEAGEAAMVAQVSAEFPGITAISVREALRTIAGYAQKLMLAIRAGGGLAVFAGILVLGGAIAAGQRARIYDAVVLKTFGATRGRLTLAYLAEFAILGAVTGLFAALVGSIAAYFILTEAMNAPFVMDFEAVATIVALGLAATIVVGLFGTWRALGQKAAIVLRAP